MSDIYDSYAYKKATITIATSTTVSDAVDIQGYQVIGLLALTTWTAGTCSFNVDPGTGTFYAVGTVAPTPVADTIVLLSTTTAPPIVTGAKVKLVSQNAQAANREVWVLLKKL